MERSVPGAQLGGGAVHGPKGCADPPHAMCSQTMKELSIKESEASTVRNVTQAATQEVCRLALDQLAVAKGCQRGAHDVRAWAQTRAPMP